MPGLMVREGRNDLLKRAKTPDATLGPGPFLILLTTTSSSLETSKLKRYPVIPSPQCILRCVVHDNVGGVPVGAEQGEP